MKCGFYEFEITPALGAIIPGGFGARYAEEIRDRIYVRAGVFTNENETVALAVIDACGITLDITERVRERVAEFCPIKKENIMVMATHCHAGGPTLNWGEEVVRDPAYLDLLVQKTADAITLSYKTAEESEIILGKEELHGYSFIRVYHMEDGTLRTNPPHKTEEDLKKILKPQTEVDLEVLVLAVKQGEKFVGAVVNYANHPAVVAKSQISGDYISQLSRSLKEMYGPDFVTVFINGACGNINHINPFDPSTKVPFREREIGKKLAETVKKAIDGGKLMGSNALGSVEKKIPVALRKPDEEYLLRSKKVFEELGDDLIASVPGTDGYFQTFYALQAFQIMADKRTKQDIVLQLMKIGDVFVAGTPNQIFVQYGKKIKEGIGAPCMVSAFANDYRGYVPTPECIGIWNVYEARLAPTSALEPAAGDKIVEGILSLGEEMKMR